jgi:alpha-D-ribose 1-methylphosphonate 5-phosphate C-P lyase
MTQATHKYMNEIPQADGSSRYVLSDTSYATKLLKQLQEEGIIIGETYFDDEGNFYHAGYLK